MSDPSTATNPTTAEENVISTENTTAAAEPTPTANSAAPADDAAAGTPAADGENAGEDGGAEGDDSATPAPVDPNAQLTVRALVSTKEAGVIIGKGGANVAELREKTGVKAGVSKVVPGVHDRVLSVSGTMDGISQAYSLIAQTILDNPITAQPSSNPLQPTTSQSTSVRLLISHNLMGTVIGRQGLKIKHIQDVSSARMVASKEMLPQSTERIVEVQGTTEAIRIAIKEIARCLLEDWDRGQGTVLYHPNQTEGAGVLAGAGAGGLQLQGSRRTSGNAAGYLAGQMGGLSLGAGPLGSGVAARRASQGATALNGAAPDFTMAPLANAFVPGALRPAGGARAGGVPLTVAPGGALDGAVVTPGGGLAAPGAPAGATGGAGATAVDPANLRTQNISIPSDMVGCIIGKGGSKITEIRRVSGSRISIAKVPHDDSGERMFTIQGTAEANEKALFLLYSQVSSIAV
ncbi:RNA binding protein, heterogenous nuclear RNP-K like protein [Tilletia horrida]|nr:RNA binding protein, heterogenous nuclear RNP-K like protein [Tilletia horrida]